MTRKPQVTTRTNLPPQQQHAHPAAVLSPRKSNVRALALAKNVTGTASRSQTKQAFLSLQAMTNETHNKNKLYLHRAYIYAVACTTVLYTITLKIFAPRRATAPAVPAAAPGSYAKRRASPLELADQSPSASSFALPPTTHVPL